MTDSFWGPFPSAESLESKFDLKRVLAMSATEYLASHDSKKYGGKKCE